MKTAEGLLSGRAAQEAIRYCLIDAEHCATTPCEVHGLTGCYGFAAMATVFSVILAVGETILGTAGGKGPPVERAIKAFCQAMKQTGDNARWLTPPDGRASEDVAVDEVAAILCSTRNALVHALSLYEDVVWSPDPIGKFRVYAKGGWVISLPSFVEAVKRSIGGITEKYGTKAWDPTGAGRKKRGKKRNPAKVGAFGLKTECL